MGLFKGQFANVVEWEEYRDDIIFWKWTNREIKKGSKLIIGMPPGSACVGIRIGFLVPHFSVNSLVLTNKTSALTPLLKPNLKPLSVDKNGIICDSI